MSIQKRNTLNNDNSEKEPSGKTILKRTILKKDYAEKQTLTNYNPEKEKPKQKINLKRTILTNLRKNKSAKENTEK